MAAHYSSALPLQVTSPFLKNSEMRDSKDVNRSDRIELGKNLQTTRPDNLISLESSLNQESSEPDFRKYRLSREILGVNLDVLIAPDNAEAVDPKKSTSKHTESEGDGEYEGDTDSIVYGGSIASTVPDRYGFIGGTQYSFDREDSTPVSVIRRREMKWLQMLDEWDKYMSTKYKKVRDRCRKGIPSAIRPRAWQYLCGGSYLMKQNAGVFEDLLAQPGDPKWLDDIRKDLHRQFPLHEMFQDPDGPGQAELFRVLKAYSILNPVDGYFQGHAPVAAMLVMHMPAEEAFWCLVAICERYLPGYYSQGLEAVQVDGDILVFLLKKISPSVYRHLTSQVLDPILYMMEWFMCIYTRTLPWASVLRVWDMFFCEGVKVLFRVGLVLLKYSFNKSSVIKACPTMYESMDLLRHLPSTITDEDFLVSHMLKLPISEEDMEKVHTKIVAKRKASQSGH